MVTISSLFITAGQVVAYAVGWWFSTTAHGWRWMVGIGALPALLQFVMLFFMPETPRWLVRAGKKQAARRVLVKIYEGAEGVNVERLVNGVLRRVEKEILDEENIVVGGREVGPVKHGLSAKIGRVQENFAQLIGIGGNRRALIIACMLQGAQQLCGFVSSILCSFPIKAETITDLCPELPDVLFRYHFRPRRLPLPNLDLTLHRYYKLRFHARSIPLHRPHRPPTYSSPLYSLHGSRPHPLRPRIQFSQRSYGVH